MTNHEKLGETEAEYDRKVLQFIGIVTLSSLFQPFLRDDSIRKTCMFANSLDFMGQIHWLDKLCELCVCFQNSFLSIMKPSRCPKDIKTSVDHTVVLNDSLDDVT